ncbi:MAG: flagellar type III secretion system pore protein FliP [Ignavibacteriaceae bacterium]|nr:flagellar type III secretion system pore protein FliP [Ignavibacteriaceae bacterium]HRI45496.1 flagellar type III secretion system pore protein FliP [Ignavibacteriaceae bacterium]
MKISNLIILITVCLLIISTEVKAQGTTVPLPKIGIDIGTSDNPKDVSVTLQVLLLMTILSLAPSIMIMTTAYLRIIIIFHFLKSAMGTQQMPPSQLLAGTALFITFFVMAPTWNKVNDNAIKPLMDGKIQVSEAYDKGIEPIREFMFNNVRDEDLELFINLANLNRPNNRTELPTYIVIPAFVISEMRVGFIIGFFLFIPFLMVDMIIASILMSMGMMMLPPMLVSLPFKILLFVLVDGWNLIIGSVVRSFS